MQPTQNKLITYWTQQQIVPSLGESPLKKLPLEVIQLILYTYLDKPNILKAQKICRYFYYQLNRPEIMQVMSVTLKIPLCTSYAERIVIQKAQSLIDSVKEHSKIDHENKKIEIGSVEISVKDPEPGSQRYIVYQKIAEMKKFSQSIEKTSFRHPMTASIHNTIALIDKIERRMDRFAGELVILSFLFMPRETYSGPTFPSESSPGFFWKDAKNVVYYENCEIQIPALVIDTYQFYNSWLS